jgi:predicted SAM-dependent methyltransferase
MSDSRAFRRRLRNAWRRFSAGLPRGTISPLVQNDLFKAHASLFEFAAAFGVGRRVLVQDEQAAFGAHVIGQAGAASVTGMMRSERARRFAQQSYGAANVRFAAPGESAEHDLLMTREPLAATDLRTEAQQLGSAGKLLIALTPGMAAGVAGASLLRDARSAFACVRRFVHSALVPVDLASPFPSTLSMDAFQFHELGEAEAIGSNAIAVLYLATNDPKWHHLKLHLGCGPISIPGWVNVDNQAYPGIDFRWDLARGLPFRDASFIFAEHFVEHLSYPHAKGFLQACRKALRDDGVLRLSTPNLDWVWQTSYHPGEWRETDESLRDCFVLNRAFRGWGHQFLYNEATLIAALHNAGFDEVRRAAYGQSECADLQGLERHEQYPDTPALPHILIVEARGRRQDQSIEGATYIHEYERDLAVR